MSNTQVLVTGSNGQLGSELKYLSQTSAFEYVFTDIEELDITNSKSLDSFFKAHDFSFCINCAAYTAVDRAETDVETAEKLNVEAIRNLATICHNHDVQLIHISTDFVFSGKTYLPLLETDIPDPISIYGKTKYDGELVARKINPSTLIIRTSWLYSSYGNNFVKTMLKLGKERKKLGVIFDQIGTPTYARDLASTIVTIMEMREQDKVTDAEMGNIFHYSNEGVASWYDFAHQIFSQADLNVELTPIRTEAYPTPAARPHYSLLDKTNIKEIFKVQIPHWRDSLEKCLDLLL
ncbi:MAG: dTDP-4-dehydrorhamnose reductase [Cyclobacteriaceae bacterium]